MISWWEISWTTLLKLLRLFAKAKVGKHLLIMTRTLLKLVQMLMLLLHASVPMPLMNFFLKMITDHSELKLPHPIRKLVLTSDCYKQVNYAWFLPKKASFYFKNSSKATKAKKANEGQQRPAKSKTSKFFDIINIQCIIINKCKCNSKKRCFKEIGNFHFHYINFLKSHFVEYVKFAKRC